MATLLLSHAGCLHHDPGPQHPESPARLRAILQALSGPDFAALIRRDARPATPAQLARAHSPSLIARLTGPLADLARQTGHAMIDADTHLSAGSIEAALLAAGAACQAVDEIMAADAANGIRNAFCAVRPPGHHAERGRAMGFCLFNNAAIGALHARAEHGLHRLAIVDFDVHHGNGTQDIFWNDPETLYISTHQSPLYPGTGAASERGAHDTVLNVPLPAGSGTKALKSAFQQQILPALDHFAPDILFISAGFDAHAQDPLAGLSFSADDFAEATHHLCEFASRRLSGRVVSTLEGGYDLPALAASVAAHLRVMMEY